MKQQFLERLHGGRLFNDGAFGTDLQKKGLKPGELPELWNLTHKEEIISHAEAFFRAGCDIATTNTFGANALKFPEQLSEIVTEGVRLAAEGRRRAGREEDGFIALDLGPTGKLLAPLGDLPFEEAVALFGQTAALGEKAGADLVLIETMNDSYELKAAVLGAKEYTDLPICATLTFNEQGTLLTGGTVESVAAMLKGLKVAALGINCGTGPDGMMENVKRLLACTDLPVIIDPNAGLPRVEDGKTVYDVGPDAFAEKMEEIARLGVNVLGGCCGTEVAHIQKMIERCRTIPLSERSFTEETVVTSRSKTVVIRERPVIIGERINPTGKKKFQEALRQHDLDYIFNQATEQEESGADILDVNVGLPEIDEVAVLQEVVTGLQTVTDLPLQIDTSNPEALEKALRYYDGKAMVNSVNGDPESIEAVMPIVAKYGGVLVGLALDSGGIPQDAEGRMAVAQRIYDAAARYGIPKSDIVIDGLAMTVSSDPGSAKVTLETLRRIKAAGGKSILGVSNISFGLPQRENVNAAFFTLAMEAGLSCGIINPNNAAMMRAYRSYLALKELDPNFAGYLAAYADAPKTEEKTAPAVKKKEHAGGNTLSDAIMRGLDNRAAELTKEALAVKEPMDIINGELIPALDTVGKGFEKGTLFLPQLLMAAEAAQAAFAVIKETLGSETGPVKGRVILATVKNDIHDIGKNIVKVLLENYGYEVLDLGKDVPPETIVDCAIKEEIRLVGLSALMTTTVQSMKETVALFREKKPDTKIVVGGAVMTQEYADMIGADYYAADAMETVRVADKVFQ